MEEKIPGHIAIIMDGNGRWAEGRGLSRIKGHRRGIKTARDIVNYASELGLRYLTLYTFSKENWSRPEYEVNTLMLFLEKYLMEEAGNLLERRIRFKAIGELTDLPKSVRKVIEKVESQTKGCEGMVLQLALSYGGRDEIVSAVRSIAQEVKDGRLDVEDISEEAVKSRLYTAGVPDPDLLIRTSGERRISNFLLWQMAYTELYVTDVLWPDFSRDDFLKAIRDYQGRERRFGLTGKQLVGA